MRIVMIVAVPLPPSEGIGIQSFGLAERLRARGHDVLFMTRGRRADARAALIAGIPVVRVPFFSVRPFHVFVHGLFLMKALRKLPSPPDIVHFHSPLVPALRLPWPVVSTFHSLSWYDFAGPSRGIRYRLRRLMARTLSFRVERKLLRRTDGIVLVNANAKRALRERYGCDRETHVLPNVVDVEHFRPTAPPSGRPVILYVGRLGFGKGLHELLRSARPVITRYPDALYRIVGGGPLEKELKRTAGALGLEGSVAFEGEIKERNVVLGHFQKATVVLLPSFSEGCPMSLLEAMSCGKPIVTTDAGFGSHILADGKNVLLVPPGSAPALAQATVRLLESPDLRRELGEAARETAVSAFDAAAHTDRMERIYEQAVARRTRLRP